MTYNIDELYKMLSSFNDEATQKMGIEIGKTIKHLSVFIMPFCNKPIWENCAKILSQKTDDELCLYYSKLFEWLKDMNWPGAYTIYSRLLLSNGKKFWDDYFICLSQATETNDYVWKTVLDNFYTDYFNKK